MVDQLEFQCPDSGWHPPRLGSIVPIRVARSAAFTHSKAAAANGMHLEAVPHAQSARDTHCPHRERTHSPHMQRRAWMVTTPRPRLSYDLDLVL
jgi:hypothetical protein